MIEVVVALFVFCDYKQVFFLLLFYLNKFLTKICKENTPFFLSFVQIFLFHDYKLKKISLFTKNSMGRRCYFSLITLKFKIFDFFYEWEGTSCVNQLYYYRICKKRVWYAVFRKFHKPFPGTHRYFRKNLTIGIFTLCRVSVGVSLSFFVSCDF